MKPTPKHNTAHVALVAKSSALTHTADDRVKIIHSQTVRQSANYQSTECVFGVEIMVDNNERAIQAGLDRAEELVENRLVAKIGTHRKLLTKLG